MDGAVLDPDMITSGIGACVFLCSTINRVCRAVCDGSRTLLARTPHCLHHPLRQRRRPSRPAQLVRPLVVVDFWSRDWMALWYRC